MEIKDIISSGLLELYITGLTSKEETLQVEQWAEQYPEVKNEIDELQNVMESYAMAQAIQPDDLLKEKILAKIKSSDSVKEKIFSQIKSTPKQDPLIVHTVPEKNEGAKIYSIPSYYKWAIAASVILLLGSLILNYTYYNKYHDTSKDLQTAQVELQKQQQIADAMNKDMDVMTDKNAMPVVLKGTEKSPDALAKIFWMKNTGDVFVDPTNLPQAPSGMQYQVWALVDGKPVDAGMISTEKGIYHIQKMKSFGKAQAFAITLETAGGNPTPKGDMIVQAKI
ncbi:MAG: anti-sigma factor [Ginsengibacter sp.]